MQDETDGWNQLEDIAGGDSIPVQNRIKIQTARYSVTAMKNLGNNIFSMQKVLGTRLDTLNEKLDQASKSADKQSSKIFWLTIALVVASIVQAAAAVIAIVVTVNSK